MICHLLCPGPSLARYRPDPLPDLTVGVNRAALRFPVDVWVCGDVPLFDQVHDFVIGYPKLITSVNTFGAINDRVRLGMIRPWGGEVKCWTDLLAWCPILTLEPLLSSSAALIYAGFSGAKTINVYGADWEGTLDWDGTAAGKNRSPDRWRKESEIWHNVLIPWMAEKEITVCRCKL